MSVQLESRPKPRVSRAKPAAKKRTAAKPEKGS